MSPYITGVVMDDSNFPDSLTLCGTNEMSLPGLSGDRAGRCKDKVSYLASSTAPANGQSIPEVLSRRL